MKPVSRTGCALIALALTMTCAFAQEYYTATIQAKYTALDQGNGRQSETTVKNADIIAACVGTASRAAHTILYSPANDAIQVVNRRSGQAVCDVMHFQGGAWTTDGRANQRVAFVFIPGQEEAVGTVILREQIKALNTRASMSGTFQMYLAGAAVLGGHDLKTPLQIPEPGRFPGLIGVTSGIGSPSVNMRLCTGTFTVTTLFVPGGEASGAGGSQSPFPTGSLSTAGSGTPFASQTLTVGNFTGGFTNNTSVLTRNLTNTVTPASTGAGGPINGRQTSNVGIGLPLSGFGAPTIGIGAPTGTGIPPGKVGGGF